MLRARSWTLLSCAALAVACVAGCGDDATGGWSPSDSDGSAPDSAAHKDALPPDVAVGDSGAAGSDGGQLPDAKAPDAPDGSDAPAPDADASPPPMVEPLKPCATGICWDTKLWPNACSFATNDEDFSSGKYNVHAYATRIHGDSEMNLSLTNSGGSWQPALILAKSDGTVVYDGDVGLVETGLKVTPVTDGRTGGTAHFKVESTTSWDGTLYVTGWNVVDSGFIEMLPTEAKYHLESESVCTPVQPGQGIAPAGAVAGEQPLGGASLNVSSSSAQGTAYRLDAKRGEHIGFRYDFTPTAAGVVMEVLRWNGTAAISMAKTDGGSGLRVLAVLDSVGDRTFWVRLSGATSSGSLQAKRTAFEEGGHCTSDCDRLLQMPLPIDPAQQGYDLTGATYREQFGRRDLLMFTRQAGRAVAAAKMKPFSIHDLSNWDGSAPPGHVSHDLGKDVDYSIYNAAGEPVWSSVCTEDSESNCVPGTADNYGAIYMARLLAPIMESGRAQYAFQDEQLHPALFSAAESLVSQGELNSNVIGVFKSVVSHWPGHSDHVHVRVLVEPY